MWYIQFCIQGNVNHGSIPPLVTFPYPITRPYWSAYQAQRVSPCRKTPPLLVCTGGQLIAFVPKKTAPNVTFKNRAQYFFIDTTSYVKLNKCVPFKILAPDTCDVRGTICTNGYHLETKKALKVRYRQNGVLEIYYLHHDSPFDKIRLRQQPNHGCVDWTLYVLVFYL